jgi:hypothetical protein
MKRRGRAIKLAKRTKAARHHQEDLRAEATERADHRRARTSNWTALETKARQQLSAERRRQGLNPNET